PPRTRRTRPRPHHPAAAPPRPCARNGADPARALVVAAPTTSAIRAKAMRVSDLQHHRLVVFRSASVTRTERAHRTSYGRAGVRAQIGTSVRVAAVGVDCTGDFSP